MKRLLLSLTLLLSVFALSAQSFTVTEKESGNVVENGASYYIYGSGNEWGEISLEFNVTANEAVSLVGAKEEVQNVEGTSNFICFGQCLSPTVYATQPYDMTAGQSDVFSAHYMYDNEIGEVAGQEQIMKYYIYPDSNPNDRFIINVTFKYSLEDVENINYVEEFSNAYPVPASSVVNFDYSFSSSVNSAIVAVYNMMGQEVLRSDISGMSGKLSLNVSDIADGVYFYSLIVNGVVEKSNKLVVRH